MKILKFKEPYSPYAPGDVAGIKDDKLAEELIKQKMAVEYKPKKQKSKKKS